jgi:hypothetical protein
VVLDRGGAVVSVGCSDCVDSEIGACVESGSVGILSDELNESVD